MTATRQLEQTQKILFTLGFTAVARFRPLWRLAGLCLNSFPAAFLHEESRSRIRSLVLRRSASRCIAESAMDIVTAGISLASDVALRSGGATEAFAEWWQGSALLSRRDELSEWAWRLALARLFHDEAERLRSAALVSDDCTRRLVQWSQIVVPQFQESTGVVAATVAHFNQRLTLERVADDQEILDAFADLDARGASSGLVTYAGTLLAQASLRRGWLQCFAESDPYLASEALVWFGDHLTRHRLARVIPSLPLEIGARREPLDS